MSNIVRLLRPDDPEWDTWMRRSTSDFYHSAAYHRFFTKNDDSDAWLAVYGEPHQFLAWPYLTRPIADTNRFDGTSVYGYTGPLARGLENDSDFLIAAWRALITLWEKQGLVTMFTSFHPLLGNAELCCNFKASPSHNDEGPLMLGRSVSIDLTIEEPDRFASYKKRFRQDLRRSAKAGLRIEHDEHWIRFDSFVKLYLETMEANNADQRYQFSADYLRDLRDALGSDCHLAIARIDNEIAAAIMFTTFGSISQAHLTGINKRFQNHSPLKLLLHQLGGIAQGLGARVLHLGAGRGGREDTLFDFKAQFSERRHDFIIGRWVLDAECYDSLCEAKERNTGALLNPDFFPRYAAK